MISKKRTRIIRKNLPKTKRSSASKTFPASITRLKSKRYTKKYLEKRDLYRRQILEKANAQFQSDLSEIQNKDEMAIENDIIQEESDFNIKMNKTLTFIENPSYITIKNERVSARGGVVLQFRNYKSMEGEPIKSILRKY